MEDHTWEFAGGETGHGKGCLERHVSHFANSNPCSHRGRAYEKAEAEKGGPKGKNRYDWPLQWPPAVKGPPKNRPDAWDFGRPGNFQNRAKKPWWHEAHHVVPNAVLRDAIRDVGAGTNKASLITQRIQNGLRKEGYNLNNAVNMIILPVTEGPSKTVRLPRHRQTLAHWSHEAYSAYVKKELDKRLSPLKPPSANCKKLPPYKASRKKIEGLSKSLYAKIIKSKASSLDAMKLEAKTAAGMKSGPGGRP